MADEPEVPDQDIIIRSRAAALDRLLRWQHRTDLIGLLSIYPKDKLAWGALLPALCTAIVCYLLKAADVDSQSFLKEIIDSSLSILPNLLGFLLGGYTILIGFGDVELLKSTTTIIKGRSVSLFLMLSSIFALTIYLQALTLGIAVVAHFTMLLPLVNGPGVIGFMYKMAPALNNTAIVVVLFLLFYSILSLRDMVMNVFGFAQQYHLILTRDRMADYSKKRQSTQRPEDESMR